MERTELPLAVYTIMHVVESSSFEKYTFLKRSIFLQSTVVTSIYGSANREFSKKGRRFEKERTYAADPAW